MKVELVHIPFKVDPRKIDVFPGERQKVIGDFFKLFDDLNIQAIQAKAIALNPFGCLKNQLEINFKPGGQGTSASMVQASGPKDGPIIRNLTVNDWFLANVSQEQASSQGDEVSHGFTDLEIKNLISKANAFFQDLAIKSQLKLSEQAANLRFVTIIKPEDQKEKKDQQKDPKEKKDQDLQRFEVFNGDGDVVNVDPCHLPYWGKIVDEVTARKLNKANLMPLYPVTQGSPMLYINGSDHVSTGRSDSCIAWQVKVIQPAKPRDTSKDPTVEELASNEFKRRKWEIQEAERQAKIPVPTHDVKFEVLTFESLNAKGEKVDHSYKSPFITDLMEGKNVFNKRCFRQVIDWDKDDSFKKLKTEKANKTFTMM